MKMPKGSFGVVAVIGCALIGAQPAMAADRHTPETLHARAVSDAPDGTPIATGAPRRLSALAGTDKIAWAFARGGKPKHKRTPTTKLAAK
jgi:hypothetical protein